MSFPDRRTANALLTLLLFGGVFTIIYIARWVFLLFVFAILFAYLIDPVVSFLQRHSLLFKNLRGPHVVEAYLAVLIVIALVAHELAPGVLSKTSRLLQEIPALVDGLSTGEVATQIGDRFGWSNEQEHRLGIFLAQHREDIQSFVRVVDQHTARAAQAMGWLIVIPILAIFFLRDGGSIASAFIQLTSARGDPQAVQSLANELNVMLKAYMRASVTLGVLSFIFYSTSMLVLSFPHAIALGVVGGILEFIPVAGWLFSAAGIIGVAILTHSHWIWMAALLGIWRLLLDYIISPRVMGHHLEIHPLMAIFAVMVGGAVGGIVGIYLSVPLMAAIRVIWRRCVSSESSVLCQATLPEELPPAGVWSR